MLILIFTSRCPGNSVSLNCTIYHSLDGEPTPVSSHAPSPSPGPTSSGSLIPAPKDSEPVYSPYTDDPEAQGGYDPNVMLQTQKQMMDGEGYLTLESFRVLTPSPQIKTPSSPIFPHPSTDSIISHYRLTQNSKSTTAYLRSLIPTSRGRKVDLEVRGGG